MTTRKKILLLLAAIVVALTQRGDAEVRSLVIPNGSYGEALPVAAGIGPYAVLVPDKVVTSTGDVPLPAPGHEPLFLRLASAVPSIRFAGQDHVSGSVMEYVGGQWLFGGNACGVSPILYLRSSTLVVSNCGVGSQGYRYQAEDGTIMSGDATYADAALNLYEWTRYGDITIGQGGAGGCVAVRGADRRLLEPGDCRFVRFNRDGNDLAVTMVKFLEHRTVLLWMTADDLARFPVDAVAPPPPVVVAPPIIVPPAPTPPPVAIADRLPDNVRAVRDAFVARFPIPQMAGSGPSDDAFENICRAWVLQLAEQVVFSTSDTSWGVKNAGGGRPQSKDSLAHLVGGRLINFDLLSGVGTGRPTLVGDPGGEDITGQSFMPVSGVNHLGTTPPPAPTPTPTATSPAGITRAELNAAIAQLHADLWNEVSSSENELRSRLERLETKPALDLAGLQAAIDQALLAYEVTGKTEKDKLGLQHVVKLGISRRKP